ncbi:MAG: hypothetical protein R3346_01480 [Candidatus Spechtbacterales bacterium]|nr:hypothetical protein [Candidatus Spechtbacterales bacterium]
MINFWFTVSIIVAIISFIVFIFEIDQDPLNTIIAFVFLVVSVGLIVFYFPGNYSRMRTAEAAEQIERVSGAEVLGISLGEHTVLYVPEEGTLCVGVIEKRDGYNTIVPDSSDCIFYSEVSDINVDTGFWNGSDQKITFIADNEFCSVDLETSAERRFVNCTINGQWPKETSR